MGSEHAIVSDYVAKERANVDSGDPMFVVRYRARGGVWRESRMTGQRVWKLVKALGRRAGGDSSTSTGSG